MVKILLTRKLLDTDIKYLVEGIKTKSNKKFDLEIPTQFTEQEIINLSHDADILLGPFITEELLESSKKLKFIQVPWTGVDNIDFSLLKNKEVTICNSHSNSSIVAEFTVGLTLDLIKKISFYDKILRQDEEFNRGRILPSPAIQGTSIGIMGYGNIGSKVGKYFSIMGGKINSFTRTKIYTPEVNNSYVFEEMQSFFDNSKIIICTLPLTSKTKGILSRKNMNTISNKPYLINVSRADIFTPNTILDLLQEKKIEGFASDVWWNQNQAGIDYKKKLAEFDNVVLSPHRAGYATGKLPHLDDAILNVSNYLEGKELINTIDIINEY